MELNDRERAAEANEGCGGWTRREVIQGAAGAGLLLALAEAPGRADAPQWVSVGKGEQFTSTPMEVTVQTSDKIFITRTDPNTLVAVSAKCTHHGCELPWVAADNRFECPCHGGQFAANGKNLQGTSRNPQNPLPDLQSVPVQQVKDDVQVNLAGIPAVNLQPGM